MSMGKINWYSSLYELSNKSKHISDGKSGDYEEIMERSSTKLLSNGSLFLQNIKEDREGYYLCQASNGIGNPIGKLVQVKVNSPPYFSAPSHIVSVKKGETAKLQCSVSGDLPIQIQWIRAGSTLDLNSPNGYRLSMKQESVGEDGVKAELTISGTEPGDGGAYFCQASNVYGKDQQLVQLLVQGKLLCQASSDLKTVLVTSRAINVQWHHASVNSAEVSHFIVQHKAGSDGRAGRSLPSEPLVVITEPQQPAGPPLNVVARAVSSTQLLVTWSPPVQELRNGDVQGYNLGFIETSSVNSGAGAYNMTGLVGDGAEEGAEYLITDLAKFTRYSIVVQAVNQVGPGPLSEPVTAQTLEDVPSWPPEDIRCVAPSSSPHSLQVSWKPPPIQHCNGILQAYKLQYDSQDEGFDDFDAKKTSSLTLLLSNLHKYTNYSIQVLAMTRVGEGVYSEPIYCQTSEDAPGSPEDIKAVVSSPESLLVTWLAPKEPNGVITKYNLYTRTMTGREELAHKKTSLMSQHLSYEVKNLNEHVEYQFWITASTKVGEGQSSKVISQIPTSRVPAKISSFGGLVRRPWRSTVSLSCLMVGLPLPRRTWLRGDSVVVGGVGGGRNIQIGEGGDLIIGNLQASESDNYTCLVENNMGSDKITYVLLVQVVPSAPILYVASATSSSILLHWRVADDGGSPISGYLLSYKKSNGDLQQSVLHRKTVNYELKVSSLPPPDSIMRGRISSALLLELKFLLPAVGVLILLLSVIVALCAICRRLRSGRRRAKETEDNEQNLEAQRERYYATMQKVPLHDKIPETSEEISPYATFQLEPPALLHSFRYQDDSVMPGCASTPPMSMSKIRRRRRSSGRKTDVDSEDSEESDHDPLTSSRTESSNHLDKKHHDNSK
ncbi:LOW QUALITY PROTEIN: Down syndrome cell adhesion molecule-like protein Dscam2 [Diaphorina citri]|uniref:LOW QUALITY PROTEIN: Down syndrome cell adhesion molecule-like protein Dscam2 n=1 Tax=Diaphorina citri TaxID=121845 RepID=A0A3Q0JC52_DIACI|nr:LOW QUALITY PROTEIN: Down syndrome cell adhesion molecule-like protein Dscam2 [Diaphorina citri]